MAQYLCKDCIHSHMDFMDKVFTLGGRVGTSSTNYKCSKFPKKETIVNNLVTGPEKRKAELPFCEIVRNHGECGKNAKYWSPKHKKDLFKMLTKDHDNAD